MAKKETSILHAGFFVDPKQLINMQSSRLIQSGDVISANMIKQENVVNNGENVSIVASQGVVEIQVAGVAKSSGKIGDKIPVMNLSD